MPERPKHCFVESGAKPTENKINTTKPGQRGQLREVLIISWGQKLLVYAEYNFMSLVIKFDAWIYKIRCEFTVSLLKSFCLFLLAVDSKKFHIK